MERSRAQKIFSGFVFVFSILLRIGYALTMSAFKIPVMEYYSVAAAIVYAVLLLLLFKTKVSPITVYVAAFTEIVAFTVTGTIAMGSKAQFSFYIFGLMPLAFYTLYKTSDRYGKARAFASSGVLLLVFYIENSLFYDNNALHILSLRETKTMVGRTRLCP